MTELKFALENNIAVETTVLENEVIVTWANSQCTQVITVEEAKKLGLVKEEVQKSETKVVISGVEVNGMSLDEVTSLIDNKAQNSEAGYNLFLSIKDIATENECLDILSNFPKSYKVRYTPVVRITEDLERHYTYNIELWLKFDENKQISKNAKPKLKKFLEVISQLHLIK